MKKVDYKKDFKELYFPPTEPVIMEIPEMKFIKVSGTGDPNGEEFEKATEALYGLTYSVKMSYKKEVPPNGYYEYTVFPMEGEWDLVDRTMDSKVKSNYKYDIMIRQPDFLTEELFQSFRGEAFKKKKNPYMETAEFMIYTEGLCCEMLHIGSYDDEPESFARMENYVEANGYHRASKLHREIYLSDPRKTEPKKLKTVLRFKIVKK